MGKVRFYIQTPGGALLEHEFILPAFAKVEVVEGKDALIEGAQTNEQPVGPVTHNPDDVSVVITPLTGDELEKARAKRDKEAEAEHKELLAEAAKAAKASGEPVEVEAARLEEEAAQAAEG